jgi:hypothetical protein
MGGGEAGQRRLLRVDMTAWRQSGRFDGFMCSAIRRRMEGAQSSRKMIEYFPNSSAFMQD